MCSAYTPSKSSGTLVRACWICNASAGLFFENILLRISSRMMLDCNFASCASLSVSISSSQNPRLGEKATDGIKNAVTGIQDHTHKSSPSRGRERGGERCFSRMFHRDWTTKKDSKIPNSSCFKETKKGRRLKFRDKQNNFWLLYW
jgi:hypothetical protein